MSHGCPTMGSFVMVCPVCPHSPRWRKDRHHTNIYEVPVAVEVGINTVSPAKKEVSECPGHTAGERNGCNSMLHPCLSNSSLTQNVP